jgi:hypothetical protein
MEYDDDDDNKFQNVNLNDYFEGEARQHKDPFPWLHMQRDP